ncbi:invasion associated locus B family protein [Rhodovibrio salinarum]|uniref:Invasion associated locus B family protein n=1 Tax=Rhodovibrio salinarum TaxID=1087 RepID=A0A934QI45_9PROT|nr:invasion associated locus B family protein [Rhodovibrio salinarum]MBK1697127.1 invasion associated locus B family protein [Rhodovibrio salinarum]
MSLTKTLASCAAALAIALATPMGIPTASAQDGGLETQLDQQQGGGLQTQQNQGQTQGQQGQQPNIESTSYDDWVVQCRQQNGQTGPCRMGQGVRNSENQQEIMQVIVARTPQQGPIVNFIVPLGVNLQAPLTVAVDGNQLGQAAYVSCVQRGCVARMQISDGMLSAMKQGRRLQVTLTGQRGNTRTVPASLLGFTDAYNALSS